ncbi:MAG: hypothetical protein ACREL1_08390, partial [bacterium]
GWAVRGRLVLLDQESRRVEKRLVRDGFQLEAFGGLLVGETPALKFLQFSGEGTSSILNAQLRNLLSLTGTPLTPHSFPAPSPGAQADWAPFQAALGQNGFVQGNVLWILPPPFTPTSDPAPGFLSMRFQKDGANLMVLGEMDPSLDRLSPLLKILAAHQMTVTSLRQGPAGAARVEWWGEAPEAGLVSALQKIIALAAPPLSDEKETASTKSPAPEGF